MTLRQLIQQLMIEYPTVDVTVESQYATYHYDGAKVRYCCVCCWGEQSIVVYEDSVIKLYRKVKIEMEVHHEP